MTKQTVDIMLLNGYLVTMDDRWHICPDGAVAIKDNLIVAAGPTLEVEAKYTADIIMDCQDCIISPGLVNAHTHAPMTLLRGLADDLRLDVWLYGYMMPVEREFVDQSFCYIGTQLACAEMIRSGVTTFCDMYYNETEVARATAEAGLRAILAQTILKFPSPDATSYDESLAYCRQFIEKWLNHPLIIPAVGPHAPYTATPDMLESCVALATEFDVPIHIHIAETVFEQDNSRHQYGSTVVPWLAQQKLFEAKVIAAHCVHLEDNEMFTLHEHEAGIAHCPSSNMKLASGFAPIQKYVDNGLHVGIGTDGPASNNDLDMFEEVRLASLLQKGFLRDPVALPAKTAWALATIEGARALHIGDITGSLEPGKRADIVVVSTTDTHQMPRFGRDPEAVYSQLVYATKSTDVRDVLVDGRVLMRERKLQTLNEQEIVAEAERIARRIDAFLSVREGNALSKLLAISAGIVPQETFEIQVKVRVAEPIDVDTRLGQHGVKVHRHSVRTQFDTYFFFDEPETNRLRFREDEVKHANGRIENTFYTMTLMGPTYEKEYENSIQLTRARYTANASHSLRFYREYFRPISEQEVVKHRARCHVDYKGTDFAINQDELPHPEPTLYLEIKARTWSAKDAIAKAEMIGELLAMLGIQSQHQLKIEYVDIAAQMEAQA